MRGRPLVLLLAAAALPGVSPIVRAHPAPFSYLDLRLDAGGVSGALVVHDLDVARELGLTEPNALLGPEAATRYREALLRALSPRISLTLDGREAGIAWGALEALPDRRSFRLGFTIPRPRPERLVVKGLVFPEDPVHQTFVNVYEDGVLTRQAIIDAGRLTAVFYAGRAGPGAVVRDFVVSGIEHILIGRR
jgi:hypothetical protein